MTANKSVFKSELCSDCEHLKHKTPYSPQPHQYLVRIKWTGIDSVPSYRCLLCQSILTFQPVGHPGTWLVQCGQIAEAGTRNAASRNGTVG